MYTFHRGLEVPLPHLPMGRKLWHEEKYPRRGVFFTALGGCINMFPFWPFIIQRVLLNIECRAIIQRESVG